MKRIFILFVMTLAVSFSSFAQKKPAGKTSADPANGTTFVITVEHNGDKTELKSSQFENAAGIAFTNDSEHGLMTINFRAGNDKKNDDNFAFEGSLDNDAKGTFPFGEGKTHFTFMSTQLANKPELSCQSGAYEITAMPLKGRYVEGTFTAMCDAADPAGEQMQHYNLSGSFRLLRQ